MLAYGKGMQKTINFLFYAQNYFKLTRKSKKNTQKKKICSKLRIVDGEKNISPIHAVQPLLKVPILQYKNKIYHSLCETANKKQYQFCCDVLLLGYSRISTNNVNITVRITRTVKKVADPMTIKAPLLLKDFRSSQYC